MNSAVSIQHYRTAASCNGRQFPIEGDCDPRFNAVRDHFVANFSEGLETGASVAVTMRGELVVDLWGGYKDKDCLQPWERDTIVNMMSVSKAASATCIYSLVDRGLVDPQAPVATYWPEFGQAGKERLPLQYILDHRGGLPVLTESLPRGSIYDWRAMTEALARQAPMWPPGDKCAYHVMTQGFILGEVIRRVTGLTLGKFFRREFGEPLRLDYHIGLPREDFARCAQFIPHPMFVTHVLEEPNTKEGIAWAQLAEGEDFNSEKWRGAEIPSANGHGNARAVARFFGMLANGGTLDGRTYLHKEAIERMATEQHNMTQELMPLQYHQASGVLLNSPPNVWMGPNPRAFGHHGAGGAIGLADPEAGIGFSYGMNMMHGGLENGPRAGGLIKATFDSLGT